MSSATLTDEVRRQPSSGRVPSAIDPTGGAPRSLGAGQFFVITTAFLVTGTAIVMRQQTPAIIVLAGFTVGAAGYAAYALYRALLPLVSGEAASDAVMIGGRTRAALERDKALTLPLFARCVPGQTHEHSHQANGIDRDKHRNKGNEKFMDHVLRVLPKRRFWPEMNTDEQQIHQNSVCER